MSPRTPLIAAIVTLGIGLAGWRDASGSVPSNLPDQLTTKEFSQLTIDLSEPDAAFISDNLVSNEMSFAQVVPQLVAVTEPGGVYLGVGPEQNFTYLSAMRARMGFIIDIRRANLQLHLMYKALFDLSPDRATFISRLFTRSRPPRLSAASTIADLMDGFMSVPAESDVVYGRNVDDIRNVLANRYHLPLSADDLDGIDHAYRAFHTYGPSIGYATTLRGQPIGQATYANLMKQTDAEGHALSYLATEATFRFVKELEAKNLVVPVVGNFAGPKAIRAIAAYLKAHGATVSAFYLSNVEDYLGREPIPQNGEWSAFCANAATLPVDDRSMFVRPLGLAVFDPDGSFRMTPKMQIATQDGVTFAAGSIPALPSALSPMANDVKGCGVHGR